ncbi:hypothetical protein PR048_015442 [Dryococelus australis]|uniref:Uncharacterized protein n=1 Tax=Dryococelus australis TaxID=614101 RepID=A0ABQ9HHZ8_9NEOP|nr:hypothetical protein PR048_015442 [Dryococelus australis]
MKREGETGDPLENLPTSGIVRHDSHVRKCGVTRPGIEPGSPCWEASRKNLSATAKRVRFPAGPLQHFRTWESCRTKPQVGGFSRGFPVAPALAFRRCYILGSQDLDLTTSSTFVNTNCGERKCQQRPPLDDLKQRQCCGRRRLEGSRTRTAHISPSRHFTLSKDLPPPIPPGAVDCKKIVEGVGVGVGVEKGTPGFPVIVMTQNKDLRDATITVMDARSVNSFMRWSMAATSITYSRYFVVTLDCICSFPRSVTHMSLGTPFKGLILNFPTLQFLALPEEDLAVHAYVFNPIEAHLAPSPHPRSYNFPKSLKQDTRLGGRGATWLSGKPFKDMTNAHRKTFPRHLRRGARSHRESAVIGLRQKMEGVGGGGGEGGVGCTSAVNPEREETGKTLEKGRRQTASSGTITTSENPGAIPPGIQPGSPNWEVINLTATPSWLRQN